MADNVTREASCACGQLAITMTGEPMLVSACCCTRCQRRTGSFFGVTAYFQTHQLAGHRGAASTFRRPDGAATFHYCATCGSSIWWVPDVEESEPDLMGVAGGAFADSVLPGPHRMTFTATGHPFVTSPRGIPTFEDSPN